MNTRKPYRHKKRFGQHFLHDEGVLNEMTDSINPTENDTIIEIGPGAGALTQYLQRCHHLLLIEIDRDLATALQKHYHDIPHIHCMQQDALTFSLADQPAAENGYRVVGNLPYNISTPLLFHLFHQIDLITDMHFLLQKEVVDRISAQPGDSHFGRLSVMSQLYCEPQALFEVGADAFDPPPKVTSAFLRLTPRADRPSKLIIDEVEQLARLAFNQRRKTISNSLKTIFSASEIEQCGINPKARPQTLSTTDFIKLAQAHKK